MSITIPEFKQIGIIRTPYKTREAAPHQGFVAAEISTIEVFEEFLNGLVGIEKFSKLIILYYFHESEPPPENLLVRPYHCHADSEPREEESRGVFTTCAPTRPNPIAVTVVELIEVNENILKVKGMDAIDGTPLLDIKPYIYDKKIASQKN